MPSINYKLYRRQYYIGPAEMLADATWKSIKLQNGKVLSYEPSLPVQVMLDAEEKEWVLLGDAYQSLTDAPEPHAAMANFSSATDVQAVYASWVGRWLLIGNNEVHGDASGLLSCYYKDQNGDVAISSVPAFLSGEAVPNTYRIQKSKGIEFYPPPDSGFKNVSKLLPSQLLNLSTSAVSFRPLECAIPQLSAEEKIQYLGTLLTTTLQKACSKKGKNYLALTGGYDSRLIMAGLNNINAAYEAVTFHYPLIRPSDTTLPKKLVQVSGKKHRLIKRGKRKYGNWKLYNTQTSCHAVERDQEYMLYQQFDKLEGNSLLLRGGGFEIGSSYMYNKFPPELLDGPQISQLLNGNEQQGASLDKWVQWVKATPQERVPWRDRYYWEQRVSGWLSSTEQALDVLNIDRLVPSNSLLFYNLLLSFPENVRVNRLHQLEMIRSLSPKLLDIPFNVKPSAYYKKYLKVVFKLEKYKRTFNDWMFTKDKV